MYKRIDKFQESATAQKNHIVSSDYQEPAKRSSNNLSIVFL